ncbi:MAG: hypothetical protein Ct9H90mP7_1840 [Candidatus Neomarinimicrobiota bacterium]|nr:MAG: hypothetical protein Ct9H90mP7_1840 [Candidatus Neomarinimicrobiota bacterium]
MASLLLQRKKEKGTEELRTETAADGIITGFGKINRKS